MALEETHHQAFILMKKNESEKNEALQKFKNLESKKDAFLVREFNMNK